MKWKFWKTETENVNKRENIIIDKIENLMDTVHNIKDKIEEFTDNNKKMNRIQYKNTQEIKSKIQKIGKKIEKEQQQNVKIEDLKEKIEDMKDNRKDVIENIINMIDEIDLILNGLSDKEGNWHNILNKWVKQLLQILKEQRIQEIKLLGKQFNPRKAEAVDTISKKELEKNRPDLLNNLNDNNSRLELNTYDIIQIHKKGFINDKGDLIRKARVTTLKEEENNE